MECHDIKEIMAPFLSGEVQGSQADEVRAHLMHCEECRQELDAYKGTWDLLASWEDEDPAPGYISRFWTRVALERSWLEKFQDAFGEIFTVKRLVPAVSVMCALLLVGTFAMRTTQTHQTEMLLTDLTLEEIEFVENLEFAENLEMLGEMEMLEEMDILDEVSSNQWDMGQRHA